MPDGKTVTPTVSSDGLVRRVVVLVRPQLRDDKQREKEEEGKKQKEDDEVNRKLEQQQLEVKMRRQLEEEAKRKETEEILAKLQRRNEELMQSEDELRRMLLEDINCTITNACYRFLDELSSEASLYTFSPSLFERNHCSRHARIWKHESSIRTNFDPAFSCTKTWSWMKSEKNWQFVQELTHANLSCQMTSSTRIEHHQQDLLVRLPRTLLCSLFLHFIIHLLFRHRKDTIAINRYSAHYERDADG
ncbi:hypothetical protein BLNAU_23698 [Blattamonas nauphoetae]|uniref:Uncharacterized protein n=1 Tax=Blattamonas nauphoetae TaxID=2049346 RepID=A0ABQ9WPH9_9EUKA|nr:hypothetical protein BLNAU_23698 [Blattamonas nauphoetae]